MQLSTLSGAELNMEGRCHCGKVGWTFAGNPESALACNCTLCRRYGALWAYDFEHGRIEHIGPSRAYVRADMHDPTIEVVHCPDCACVSGWRALRLEKDGRRRLAVNLRLADADAVADLPVVRSDGLDTFEDLPDEAKRVRDLWF